MNVLLIEDNPGDILLTQRFFAKWNPEASLTVAEDGEEALRMIRSDKPDLILMDLRLPKRSGFEILRELKYEEETRHIPVIVLTSSEAEMDVASSYNNFANAYLVKPIDYNDFSDTIRNLGIFWIRNAGLRTA